MPLVPRSPSAGLTPRRRSDHEASSDHRCRVRRHVCRPFGRPPARPGQGLAGRAGDRRGRAGAAAGHPAAAVRAGAVGSEEHTSELQSLMRISYSVLCLKKKKYRPPPNNLDITLPTSDETIQQKTTTNHNNL